MSLPIQSPSESLEISQTFSSGTSSNATTAAAEPKIFRFERKADVPPAHGQTIDDLVDDWSRDSEFAEELKAARARRGQQLAASGPATLKAYRLAKGMSQADVARSLGTSQPHVARIENGTSCPTFETARRLGRVLQIDMNTLDILLPNMRDNLEVTS